ncbi:EAL domain-containing protein [Chromobacterium sp. IIBBL 290-4]|uniref:EAL domain-containing protein n=1 Tax=Chromobacterium sp. IIBBL 290-4 TaxID=2953890 RepID=UPI0020B6A634|nr:EAL domain-containing protein [Chromobacterium sp. IIBBL 290-4]UTH73194.1 EAL domain-containing protein [Chromobacterium sp. IIBBL 290-4]
MIRMLGQWLSRRALQMPPGLVYGLAMSACLAMAALALCLQIWLSESGKREAEAEWLSALFVEQLSPASAALNRISAVSMDAPMCERAGEELAAIVRETPHVRYAARRDGGMAGCASDPAAPMGMSLQAHGAGSPVLTLRRGGAELGVETDWALALLRQSRQFGASLSLRLNGQALSADGLLAASDEQLLARSPSSLGEVAVWGRSVSIGILLTGLAARWDVLLLALLIGAQAASWLLRSAGVRNASDWEILEGIRHQEFFAHYQPIVTAASGECVGVEVLARWKHPVQGNVRSDLFIQTAIDAGLIVPLTRYLLGRVVGELKQVVMPPGFMVCVNIASEHLAMPELEADCRDMLAMLREKQALLVLEVSERAPLREDSGAQEVIRRLRKKGVRLALDDFGAGYADKAYLQRWGFDYLKVEKGYVSALGHDCLRGNVLDGLLLSSSELGAKVIVKGVETQGQQNYLNVRGFEYLQGFYFGKPMALNHFRQWLYSGIIEDRRSSKRRRNEPGDASNGRAAG